MRALVVVTLALLLLPAAACAGNASSPSTSYRLLRIKHRVETIDNLENRGLIDGPLAASERRRYLGKAAEVLGRPVTHEQLEEAVSDLDVVGGEERPRRLLQVPTALGKNESILFFVVLLALAIALWFAVGTKVLSPIVGSNTTGALVRLMSVTLVLMAILGVLTLLRVKGTDLTGQAGLEAEALTVLAYVFYGGLLVISSKWYGAAGFIRIQMFAWVAALSGLCLAFLWPVHPLKGLCGTFVGLYAVIKYLEVPWKKRAYIIAALGLAAIGYAAYLLRLAYPELFLF